MKEYFDENELSEEELREKLRKQREMRAYRKMKRRRKRLVAYSILLGIFCVSIVIIVTIVNLIFFNGEDAPADTDGNFNVGVSAPPTPILDISLTSTPIPKQTKGLIVIDPGHGGMDGGTSGNGIVEKDLVLQVSEKLKGILEENGYEVYMTREEDVYIGLTERPKGANALANPLMFLSIHMNAVNEGADTSPNGTEIICYEREGSMELADLLLDQIVASIGSRKRSVLYSTGMVVTREANMPACLIECGFISNPEESKNLTDSDYQDKLVQGIFNGVELFLETYPQWGQKEQ